MSTLGRNHTPDNMVHAAAHAIGTHKQVGLQVPPTCGPNYGAATSKSNCHHFPCCTEGLGRTVCSEHPPETETCHAVNHCRQLDVTMPAATEGLAREGQVGAHDNPLSLLVHENSRQVRPCCQGADRPSSRVGQTHETPLLSTQSMPLEQYHHAASKQPLVADMLFARKVGRCHRAPCKSKREVWVQSQQQCVD